MRMVAGMIAGAALIGAGGWWVFAAGDATGGLLPYRDAAAVRAGAALYAGNCAVCHGDRLQGEPDWRQADAEGFLPAPPHDDTGHTWHHPDAQLFAITKFGTEAIVGGTYRSRMTGFGDTLSDDDIRAVLGFIKSTWPQTVIDRHNRINADAEG